MTPESRRCKELSPSSIASLRDFLEFLVCKSGRLVFTYLIKILDKCGEATLKPISEQEVLCEGELKVGPCGLQWGGKIPTFFSHALNHVLDCHISVISGI